MVSFIYMAPDSWDIMYMKKSKDFDDNYTYDALVLLTMYIVISYINSV